ncbi:unnamed protein product, partial [Sphagnum jensenii]
KESEKCVTISAKILNDNKNNNSIHRNICESHNSNTNIFMNKETLSSKESIINKSPKFSIFMQDYSIPQNNNINNNETKNYKTNTDNNECEKSS